MVSNPTGLCCASTTSQSHPIGAIDSAAAGEHSESQLPTTAWPAANLALTGFSRILDTWNPAISTSCRGATDLFRPDDRDEPRLPSAGSADERYQRSRCTRAASY